jgi:outer membrane protein OmpA-like peptidoglycan-associated protein
VLTSPNGTGTAGGTVARPAVTGTAGVSAQGKFGASGGADPSGSAGASSPKNGGPTGDPAPGASHVPVVVPTAPNVKPSVQRGNSYTFESDLLFKTDSTDLSDAAQAQLQELATTIRAQGVKGKVQVNGYTDSQGTDAYNRNLSMQRARAVANALSGYLAGGKVVEIEAQGFGESEPFKTNDTAAGRKENRRVVVVVPISS